MKSYCCQETTDQEIGHSLLEVECLCEDENLIPAYASESASGVDFRARLTDEKLLLPGETLCVPTGVYLAIPNGYELQIRPRSGLALKSGITVLNTPGTIDADYRGEIAVILINHGKQPVAITPGMRIAQGVFAPIMRVKFLLKESLSSSTRGSGGFGHTGTH